jgi:hypothetical protein
MKKRRKIMSAELKLVELGERADKWLRERNEALTRAEKAEAEVERLQKEVDRLTPRMPAQKEKK